MKHWPSQLFPLIMLSVLAALTFWLQSATAPGDEKHDGKFRHDPDAIAENYVVRRFDETGTVKYRLTGPYMVHYPDDDTSELRSPILVSYRPDAPQVTIHGQFCQGHVQGRGRLPVGRCAHHPRRYRRNARNCSPAART